MNKNKERRPKTVEETKKPETATLPVPEESPPAKVLQFARRQQKHRPIAQIPKPGFAWNPLWSLPPNMLCPCLSGVKFKRCCRPRLPRVVTEDVAKGFKAQIAMPDLVFQTPHNAEKIAAKIAQQTKAMNSSSEGMKV
jgi:hypothetical protein